MYGKPTDLQHVRRFSHDRPPWPQNRYRKREGTWLSNTRHLSVLPHFTEVWSCSSSSNARNRVIIILIIIICSQRTFSIVDYQHIYTYLTLQGECSNDDPVSLLLGDRTEEVPSSLTCLYPSQAFSSRPFCFILILLSALHVLPQFNMSIRKKRAYHRRQQRRRKPNLVQRAKKRNEL